MSGGGQKSGGTTTFSLPSWMQPYQQDILNTASQLAKQPYTPYTGQRQAGFSQDEQNAMDMIRQRAQGPNALQSGAESMLSKTLNGDFLNGNPYLDKMVGRAQDITARNYANGTAAQTDAAAARAGAFGNTGFMQQVQNNQDTLGQNLGDIATNMYGQNYAQERNNMMGAAQLAPAISQAGYMPAAMLGQIGGAQRAQQQGLLDINYQDFLNQQNYPLQRLGILSDALGAASGGTGTSKTSQAGGSSGGWQGAAGGALSGASAGSAFGPWGAAIGGIGGGLLGYFS